MEILWTGGNPEQRQLWLEGLENLLNLPLDDIPFTEEVHFLSPSAMNPTGEAATPFAETIWSSGQPFGTIQVRNDAPGFGKSDAGLIAEAQGYGVKYNARLHFHETAVHETGHAVFQAIAPTYQKQIAALFGVSNHAAELFPEGKEWKDRPGEAIAEVFKEAFLPSSLRVFPNRTNIQLSYSEYPRFRRLVREGLEHFSYEVEEGEEKEIIPPSSINLFAGLKNQDVVGGAGKEAEGLFTEVHVNESGENQGWVGLFEIPQTEFADRPESENSATSVYEAWVPDGTVISASKTIPAKVFEEYEAYKINDGVLGEPYGEPYSFELLPDLESALDPYSSEGDEFSARPAQWVHFLLLFRFNRWKDPSESPDHSKLMEWVWRKSTIPLFLAEHNVEHLGSSNIPFRFRTLEKRPKESEKGEHYAAVPLFEEEENGLYCYNLARLNRKIEFSITVDKYFTKTKVCNGVVYRHVKLEFLTLNHFPEAPDKTKMEATQLSWIPSKLIVVPKCVEPCQRPDAKTGVSTAKRLEQGYPTLQPTSIFTEATNKAFTNSPATLESFGAEQAVLRTLMTAPGTYDLDRYFGSDIPATSAVLPVMPYYLDHMRKRGEKLVVSLRVGASAMTDLFFSETEEDSGGGIVESFFKPYFWSRAHEHGYQEPILIYLQKVLEEESGRYFPPGVPLRSYVDDYLAGKPGLGNMEEFFFNTSNIAESGGAMEALRLIEEGHGNFEESWFFETGRVKAEEFWKARLGLELDRSYRIRVRGVWEMEDGSPQVTAYRELTWSGKNVVRSIPEDRPGDEHPRNSGWYTDGSGDMNDAIRMEWARAEDVYWEGKDALMFEIPVGAKRFRGLNMAVRMRQEIVEISRIVSAFEPPLISLIVSPYSRTTIPTIDLWSFPLTGYNDCGGETIVGKPIPIPIGDAIAEGQSNGRTVSRGRVQGHQNS